MNRRCHDCKSGRREINNESFADNVVCLHCHMAKRTDPPLPDLPRPRVTTPRRAKPVPAGRLFDTLDAIDLSPIIVDDKTPLVRCLCPVCGSPDAEGIWRSVLVDGRQGIAVVCEGGCRHEKVVAALRALLTPERGAHVA